MVVRRFSVANDFDTIGCQQMSRSLVLCDVTFAKHIGLAPPSKERESSRSTSLLDQSCRYGCLVTNGPQLASSTRPRARSSPRRDEHATRSTCHSTSVFMIYSINLPLHNESHDALSQQPCGAANPRLGAVLPDVSSGLTHSSLSENNFV